MHEGKTSNPQQSTGDSKSDRHVRVFVSSTFRDMVEDRNALMTHCWPELRRFCRERQVELSEVDLRWGVSEEQSTRKETVKLCLDEINACRPFFIGLLGSRYGWVPDDDALTDDLKEEQPWLRDLHGRSVTELEILHGVINNPDMAGRAFFYFRDPAFRKEEADFAAEDAESAAKQDALKERIKMTCAAKKIQLREKYSDPTQLAALVLQDMKVVVESQFPKGFEPDPLIKEAQDHEAFGEIRRRTYIGRAGYFDALDRCAAGDGGPLVVLGEPGSGKSALLANWVDHWRKANPKDFVFQHYIGGTPDSADHWRLIRRLVAEIKRWSKDQQEIAKTHDDLLRDFPVWLAKARNKAESQGVRFIIILDGLDELEKADHARSLGWLPAHSFTGPLRLILSTLAGDTLDAVDNRGWASLRIQPLTVDERRRMITGYLARFGKKLDGPRIECVAAAAASASPLYLKVLLDELRVTGAHDRLDECLGEYLMATDIQTLLRKVLERYQRNYESARPGLVADALSLLWAARCGLSEAELLQLLKPANLPQLPMAIWSPLRAALEESLVDRGGILNFAHNYLRIAVESTFIPDTGKRQSVRMRLIKYFAAQAITERTCDELPWLLRMTDDSDGLRACLLDVDRFLILFERDENELFNYWLWLKEEKILGRHYVRAFEAWEVGKAADIRLASAANEIGAFLNRASLYADSEHVIRRALAVVEQNVGSSHPFLACILTNLMDVFQETSRSEEAEGVMRRILALDEDRYGATHQRVAQDLSNLGQLLIRRKPEEAEDVLRRALSIYQSHGMDSESSDVATCMSNLAMLLRETGRTDDAERLARTALDVARRAFGVADPVYALRMNNLVALLREAGKAQEAEPLARRALTITEQCYGPHHPQVALCLGNLALVLDANRRFPEAEAFMRRSLDILLEATHAMGKLHERLQDALVSYAVLLRNTGLESDEIAARLNALCHRHGVDPALTQSPVLLTQEAVRRKYQALLARMKETPDRANEIFESLRTEDPAFFLLMQAQIEEWSTRNPGKHP